MIAVECQLKAVAGGIAGVKVRQRDDEIRGTEFVIALRRVLQAYAGQGGEHAFLDVVRRADFKAQRYRVDQFDDFDPRRDYKLTLADGELTDIERNARAASSVEDIDLDLEA